MRRAGHYTEQQNFEVFLFLVQTFIFLYCCTSKKIGKDIACQGNFVFSVLAKSSRVADPEICCRQIVCLNIIVFLLASNPMYQAF